MADKNGVVLVMFDLPNASKAEQRAYRHFHKYIISKGYCRIQKSIYVKLLRNIMNAKNEITDLKAMSPDSGNIAVVPMTLSNFKKMEFVLGKEFDFSVFSKQFVIKDIISLGSTVQVIEVKKPGNKKDSFVTDDKLDLRKEIIDKIKKIYNNM